MEKPNERRPRTKIQWHPAFCAAAELELRFNKDDLEFKREYNLSKKPLQMDLLIIEKRKGVQIQNEIGKIFRAHNIIEFKSPDDGMTIDNFQDSRICLPVQRLGRKSESNSAKRIDRLTFSGICSEGAVKPDF